MRRICISLAIACLCTSLLEAQQTIYWSKDHIYNGPGGGKVATATPLPSDQTAPTKPAIPSKSGVTATSVVISWSAVTDTGGSGLAGYKVYRKKGSNGYLPVAAVGTGVFSFTDQHLEPSTSYTFKVLAFDNAQNHSALSTGRGVTTLSSSGDSTNPDAPVNLTGEALNPQPDYDVRLEWSPSTDAGGSGIAGYKVYRDQQLISGGSPITTTYYEDSTSTANTTFEYEVKAVDGEDNESALSDSVEVTTLRELIFSDDFNRADESSGTFQVRSNTLVHADPDLDEWDNYFFPGGSQADLRISVDILSRSSSFESGIIFWRASTKRYRAYLQGSVVRLKYFWGNDQYTDSLGSASIGTSEGQGTLVVEADSSTRQIKVYWNGVLKIDFTETDTSRPNSGTMGVTGYMDNLNGGDLIFDNVLAEK